MCLVYGKSHINNTDPTVNQAFTSELDWFNLSVGNTYLTDVCVKGINRYNKSLDL